MREDDRSWRSKLGTVYPDDRHIVISEKVSTIIQFRHIDYAMERCVLNVTIPQRTKKFDPFLDIVYPSTFDIWILDIVAEISRYTDTVWKFAPRRRKLFTTLTFSENDGGGLSSEEFHCPSNEFTTLEFACSPALPSCRVDFWQDRRTLPSAGTLAFYHSDTILNALIIRSVSYPVSNNQNKMTGAPKITRCV
ncbi:hypothetical protein BDZ97DRAFT_1666087 [Flammula alnicola]|nr:hypothetical protein BDZ97DRAFT_1666087 [Flammula alnicola]